MSRESHLRRWHFAALLGILQAGLAHGQVQELTAKVALPIEPAPNVAESGFEGPLPFPHVSFAPGSWGAWTMTGDSGRTKGNAGQAAPSQSAPEGNMVGYLGGQATMTFTLATSNPLGRIRFMAAQRSTNSQVVRVYIDGVLAQSVSPEGPTYEEFVSRPILAASTTIDIQFEGQGSSQMAFIDQVLWEPLRAWDTADTWVLPSGCDSPSPPQAVQPVVIPSGTEVAITSQSCMGGAIKVQGELLAANTDGELTAHNVLVGQAPGALFEVGQEGAPFEEDFRLILNEAPSYNGQGELNPGQMPGGWNFLVVTAGGTLSLHGAEAKPWTRVAEILYDINTSLSTVAVTDEAGWRPQDKVVISGARQQDMFGPDLSGGCNQSTIDTSRVVTIKSVSAGGKAYTLVPSDTLVTGEHVTGVEMPRKYYNSNNTVEPADYSYREWSVDMSSYVGRLTRNITIEGGFPGPSSAVFGGHVMVMDNAVENGDPTDPTGFFVEGVEFVRMGQLGEMGRYPIHWHLMVEAAAGHYLRNCSIHDSFNRAVTIHGTDGVLIEGNVIHEALGHAVFLEDGAEQSNVFRQNLVIGTRRPSEGKGLIPSDNQHCDVQDRSPASFWITNPSNTFEGNVVTDTVGTAYWFAFPESGVFWPSSDISVVDKDGKVYGARSPRFGGDLHVFDSNVAVNCGSGIDMNDIILRENKMANPPVEEGETKRGAWSPSASTTAFTNFVAYGCYDGIYTAGLASDHTVLFDNPILLDNVEALRVAGGTTIVGGLIDVNSGYIELGGYSTEYPDVGYAMYDGNALVDRCHFVGFNDTSPSGPAAIRNTGGRSISAGRTIQNATFEGLAGSKPHILFDNYPQLPLSPPMDEWGDGQYLGNPRKWGHTMKLGDAYAWMGTSPAALDVSITGNHPLTVTPSGTLQDLVTGVARLSSDRYGYFRFDTIANLANNMIPRMTVERRRNFRASPADPRVGPYDLPYTTDPHRMFPVIMADTGDSNCFVYFLDFVFGPNDPPMPSAGVKFLLEDVAEGDAVILRLDSFDNFPTVSATGGRSGTIQVLDSNSTVAELKGAVDTAYLKLPNGYIWLKLVGGGPDDLLTVKLEP